jgi:hypothetical protein
MVSMDVRTKLTSTWPSGGARSLSTYLVGTDWHPASAHSASNEMIRMIEPPSLRREAAPRSCGNILATQGFCPNYIAEDNDSALA